MMGFIYRKFLKPILFLFPADDVHHLFLRFGNIMGKISIFRWKLKLFFSYKNSLLNQKILNIDFSNPVGLAAGFDYDADLIEILPSIGFGYHTIGTITNLSYDGNPRPMLGRLPKSKSLLVNKGFKNMGIDRVLEKIKTVLAKDSMNRGKRQILLGISIGSTNKSYQDIKEMVDDIISSFQKVIKENYFDYYELNISCPNLINTENGAFKFDNPEGLLLLLNNLEKLSINKPLFIKMYLEKSINDTLALANVASNFPFVRGLIFSNLVKDRNNSNFNQDEIKKAGRGNFSGKPTEKITNDLISEIYKKYKDRFIIIGCGGIFSGEDAYEKIKRGASLVQLITGMIYEGPSVIKKINKDLVKLLKKDGYNNINEAVGAYHK
jgi:dihydroorotate dehydrogenase